MPQMTATAPKYPLLARGVEAYNRGVERLGATPSLWSALGLGDSGPIPAANVSGKDVVGLLDFLGAPALSKTAERIAYGEPLTTGRGQTLRMLPETEEAVLAVAPGVVSAGMAGVKGAKKAADYVANLPPEALAAASPRGGVRLSADDRPMIVTHNASQGKILGADRLGGLPVPSLAISRADTPLDNFGDITLVGRPEMAVPSAKNPVFRSDAYTARKPQVITEVSKSDKKKLSSFFGGKDIEGVMRNLSDPGELRYDPSIIDLYLSNNPSLRLNRADFPNDRTFRSAQERQVYDSPDYWDFVSSVPSMIRDAGIETTDKIFKGYTNMGNRRYAPATLENIVKEMKGGPSTEGFNYGVGNLRAMSQPRFKSMAEIQSSRQNLLTPDEFKPFKEELSQRYSEAMNSLAGRYDPSDALLEAAQYGPSVLRARYPDVSDFSVAEGLLADLKRKDLPTEYFEIKPQRAVRFDEFAGAVLPNNASAEVINALRRRGLQDLRFYNQSADGERASVIRSFRPEMFAVAPVAPAGLLSLEEAE